MEPMMALARPPRDPAAGVARVKTSSEIPPKPRPTRVQRMAASAMRARAVKVQQNPVNTRLMMRRRSIRAFVAAEVIRVAPDGQASAGPGPGR